LVFLFHLPVSFKITILGSSGAVPAYGRFPSAQLVEIQNEFFLVDCAEGAQMQMMRFECNWHRINHVFISHLHGDHYLGLMGLIFTMHLNHRTSDLHIYSHRGLDEIITAQLRHSHSVPRFRLVMHPLTPGLQETIFENTHLTVQTIPLTHKLDCSGFLFREKEKPRRIDKEKIPSDISLQQLASLKTGADVLDEDGKIRYYNRDLTLSPRKSRSYAYCSDTSYDMNVANIVRHVDVLYHEATFMEEERDKAVETLHATAKEAALVAQQASVGKLLIGHYSARYKELEPLLQEAKSVFPSTYLAMEGETLTLEE
jgi:ribonuclease Z